MDEQTLIKRLIDGDEQAFTYVVSQYQALMGQIARSIVGEAIADEVVQESWLSIIRALPKFEGRSSLKTWMMRIVSNTAKTRLRKEARSSSVGNAQDVEDYVPSERFRPDGHWEQGPTRWSTERPEELLAQEQLKTALQQQINQLPVTQRAVLTLREMEGLEMDEVCKILDISHANARVLLHRARTTLWQVVERYEDKSC